MTDQGPLSDQGPLTYQGPLPDQDSVSKFKNLCVKAMATFCFAADSKKKTAWKSPSKGEAVVRLFGGLSSKWRSSMLQPDFLSTTETCPGAGRPSRLPPLHRAAPRRRCGVMGADLGAWRPVHAGGVRHPGQPSTDHTAPGNLSVPAAARRIWWSPFPGGGPAAYFPTVYYSLSCPPASQSACGLLS